MKITKVILEGFRGYHQRTEIDFDAITVVVGKNDIGKSSILEAIDVFFENRKIDADDKCIKCGEAELVTIGIEFNEFPENLIIDEAVETNLNQEYLTNSEGKLEIHKQFKIGARITELPPYFYSQTSLLDTFYIDTLNTFRNVGIIRCIVFIHFII